MNQSELRAQLDEGFALIKAELPANKPAEAKVAAFVMLGLCLFGELLIDIKRIADAAEINAGTKTRSELGQ